MGKNQSFWQNIATIGKNILAHVNFSFNGADGSIHIDIIPTDPKEIFVEEVRQAIGQVPEAETLPEPEGVIQPENSETVPGTGGAVSGNIVAETSPNVEATKLEDSEASSGDEEVAITSPDVDTLSSEETSADTSQSGICHEG